MPTDHESDVLPARLPSHTIVKKIGGVGEVGSPGKQETDWKRWSKKAGMGTPLDDACALYSCFQHV